MKDFESSTLWSESSFDRYRQATGHSGFARLDDTLISTFSPSLKANLQEAAGVDYAGQGGDVLEAVAACIRHGESAMLVLRCERLVWPVTLFPHKGIYHCPQDLTVQAATASLAKIRMDGIEPSIVPTPEVAMYRGGADPSDYHALQPLLWALSLYGPRRALLTEIAGNVAYRALIDDGVVELVAPGALGSALRRLKKETVSLKTMTTWPGMTVERASRLLNALYLVSGLMMTRSGSVTRIQHGVVGRTRGI